MAVLEKNRTTQSHQFFVRPKLCSILIKLLGRSASAHKQTQWLFSLTFVHKDFIFRRLAVGFVGSHHWSILKACVWDGCMSALNFKWTSVQRIKGKRAGGVMNSKSYIKIADFQYCFLRYVHKSIHWSIKRLSYNLSTVLRDFLCWFLNSIWNSSRDFDQMRGIFSNLEGRLGSSNLGICSHLRHRRRGL